MLRFIELILLWGTLGKRQYFLPGARGAQSNVWKRLAGRFWLIFGEYSRNPQQISKDKKDFTQFAGFLGTQVREKFFF
ncbi:hypothetical protein [Corynebacterium sp. c24Ua_83]|uniref:hypothetical protein n=1 Tax=Corynebacterium sp. c24Ua_83 TaxID=3032350 RepID=UPI003262FC84